ncbi:MAG: ribonuclease III [Desulfobacterales bacterium]|nr:MAG: ribonuclease III [Desulfobacterales bacterium]
METPNRHAIEEKLQYEFACESLLNEALRHSSFVNEQADSSLRDNERLEFLGDAVLNLVIGHLLMRRYPELNEGDLSKLRANLVNESQLAKIARGMDLGVYIQLGKGEIQTNGRDKNSILADTLEALVAAIYLDGGFQVIFQFLESKFAPFLKQVRTSGRYHDYKSELQEFVQVQQQEMPNYEIIHEEGPDHDKTFRVQLEVCGLTTQGIGKSKKMAEQDAAGQALQILKKDL